MQVEAVGETEVLVVEAVRSGEEPPRKQQQHVRRDGDGERTPAWERGRGEAGVRRDDEQEPFVLGQQRPGEGERRDRERPALVRHQPARGRGQRDCERQREGQVRVRGQQLVEQRRRERQRDEGRPEQDAGDTVAQQRRDRCERGDEQQQKLQQHHARVERTHRPVVDRLERR